MRLALTHDPLLRLARGRPETNAACGLPACAAANHGNAFLPQKIGCERGVLGADVRQVLHHTGAAKDLRFQPVSFGAGLQQLVDQQLHCMDAALDAVSLAYERSRQEEVIHATDACAWIAHARSHARAEYGRQRDLRVGRNSVFTLDQVDVARASREGLRCYARRRCHVSAPNTCSILPLRSAAVNGFTR